MPKLSNFGAFFKTIPMHRIYFDKRGIIICRPEEAALTDPNAVELHLRNAADIPSYISLFESTPTLDRIYIPSDDPESTYKAVCGEFKEVNAAGGLVSNRRGDFLLIRRDGLWDLPKGHQEAGEDISVTAIREVQEETGVDNLILGDLICVTDHCYRRNGIWHLKHTWWYQMTYDAPVDLSPQTEEDITKAAWVARSSLPPFLKDTYPSIKEVFTEARQA